MVRYHMLTTELIRNSGHKAREMGHSYVGSVHLLLAMLTSRGTAGELLRGTGMDPVLTEKVAAVLWGTGTPELPLPQGLSPEAACLLRQAAAEAKTQGCREVAPGHVLLAMSREKCGTARQLLLLSGVDTDALFTNTVDQMRWEAGLSARMKKERMP